MKSIINSLSFLILLIATPILAQNNDHNQIKLFRFGSFENEKPAVEYPDGTRRRS